MLSDLHVRACRAPCPRVHGPCALQVRFQGLHAALRQAVDSKVHNLSRADKTGFSLRLLAKLVNLLASYMPYYVERDEVVTALMALPPLSAEVADYPKDYMIEGFCTRLRMIPAQKGLARYLDGLVEVARQLKDSKLASEVAKSRLENQLYFLTMPGGPRCASLAATCTSCLCKATSVCSQPLKPPVNIVWCAVQHSCDWCWLCQQLLA